MSGFFRGRPALLRAAAGGTAAAVSWLVTSPALAAATVRPPRPLGHVRALSRAEMARIVGAQRPPAEAPSSLARVEADPASGTPEAWEGQVGAVSTFTGNKLTEHPVVSWTQRGGLPVALSLYHSSIGATNNSVGKKWTHSYNVYLLAVAPSGGGTPGTGDPGGTTGGTTGGGGITPIGPGGLQPMAAPLPTDTDIQIVEGNGRGVRFVRNIDGTFSAPAGVHDALVRNGDGSYTLTRKGGVKWNFRSDGFLTSVVDRNNNALTLAYDSSDRLQSVTDATGRQITFAWDTTNNRITSVTDPLGRVWDFAYDTAGNLTGVTDPPTVAGGTTRYVTGFAYDGANRITQVTDRRGKAWTFGYNTNGSLAWEKTPLLHQTSYAYGASTTTITDPRGFSVVHTYSTAGNLASVKDQANHTESYAYDANRNRTGVTDRRGKAWSFTFDTRGNVLTRTNPQGHTWSYTYNGFDQVLTETTPLGRVTTNVYDVKGNLTSTSDPLGHATTYTVNSYGQVTKVTDATSRETTIAYDANGYPNSVTNAAGTTATAYNGLGWPTGVTDATGKVTTTAYDNLGRVTSVTKPGGRATSFTYDAAGNKLTETNALGQTDTFAYDDSGRLVGHTDALNRTVAFAYDGGNNRTTFTDGRGKVTAYSYTARGELSGIAYPDGTGESFTYLATGQPLARTDGRGVTVSRGYDDAGRLTLIDYPAGSGAADVTFGYDNDGRRTSMSDGTGATAWAYDADGRVTTRSTPQGGVTFAYDNADRLTVRAVAGASTETYTYDAAGRVGSVAGVGGTTSYAYDAAGRVTQVTMPNGTVEARTYDGATTDLTGITTVKSGATVSSFTYANDGLGRRTGETLADGTVVTYGYDAAGQIISESRTPPAPSAGYVISYGYDTAGNRTSRTVNGVPEFYAYDDANKLLSAGGKTYTYDLAGNVTAVASAAGTTTLTWDGAGRLAGIAFPGGATNSFAYNGLGQRVGKADSTSTASYTLADDSIDAQVLADGAARYAYGANGVLLAESRAGTPRFYGTDALGSTKTLTDSAGALTDTFATDAFGNAWMPGRTGTTPTPFGFGASHGYQSDNDSGLMRLGHRYYDPSVGRFLSRDPILDGYNWYAYCANDPVNLVDPTGLKPPYSDWNPFSWEYDFTLDECEEIANQIDTIADVEMWIGGVPTTGAGFLALIGINPVAGVHPTDVWPDPYKAIRGMPGVSLPNKPATPAGIAGAIIGGIGIGGMISKGVAWIMKKEIEYFRSQNGE